MNLKQERKRAHLSQGRLAKLAGVDTSLISLLERGRRPRVSHDAAVRIARALNVSSEDLFPVPEIVTTPNATPATDKPDVAERRQAERRAL